MPSHPAWIHPVPNLLTGLRLLLAAGLPFVPTGWRLRGVVVAAASDGLDGWIARRFDAATSLGRLLDGVADKAVSLAVVVTLTLDGSMRVWQGLLVLSRDLVVAAITGLIALRGAWGHFRHVGVRWLGKVTTLLAFLWFASLLLALPPPVAWTLFTLAALASLAAAVDYLLHALRVRAQLEGSPRG